jgi:AraC-like DNA-binding protein
MPDGCADLVWDGSDVFVVGARTETDRFPVSAASRNVGLRLRPGVAGAMAGCRASDLVAGSAPLADLWGRRAAGRLESALAGATGATGATDATGAAGDDEPHLLLERAVASRLRATGGPDPAVVEAGRLLHQPDVTVEGVAAAVGLSGREMRRRFPDHVGYGPKVLQRVLRFQRFLSRAPDLVAGAISLASAGVEAGYADQSHLGRECRRLAGSSPADLVRRWAGARSGRNVPDAA